MSFEALSSFWQEGMRRLEQADPSERQVLERVVDALVLELRRRLGGPFTTGELARLYERDGIDWAFSIATRVAPATPAAWDMDTVANAAFARYVRSASDFAGGRRLDRGET
ncbi:MAG: hypothetical protein ACTHQQ_15505 [Solirubrobacteraceae bacterium]